MAARPSWKGHLRLSLVSCPVRLYPAVSGGSRVSFHLLHKDTLKRISMRPHDPELGEVERADLVKGYEYEKGHYVVMEPEDFERVQIESTRTIVVEQFVDVDALDQLYLETPYYLAPDGDFAGETFGVIREAMRLEKKAALSRLVLSSREHLIAMTVRDSGFLVTTLRTADEVRGANEIFGELDTGKPDKEMLQLAIQLIRQKAGKFNSETFRDRYQDALMEVIGAKIKGEKPVIAEAPETGRVINLMDALKRSLAESGETPARKPPARSKARKPAAEAPRKPKRVGGRR